MVVEEEGGKEVDSGAGGVGEVGHGISTVERVIVIGVATAVEAAIGGAGAVADGPMGAGTDEKAENISFVLQEARLPGHRLYVIAWQLPEHEDSVHGICPWAGGSANSLLPRGLHNFEQMGDAALTAALF